VRLVVILALSLPLDRLIRDQANKTFDVYVQRIRKYAGTMADTVIPASAPTEAHKVEPRVGTPSDNSWAGWAISSFTNKIATADGEIEPTASSVKPADPETARSASVPRPAKSSPSLELHKQALRPTAQTLNRSMSDRPPPVVHNYEPEEEEEEEEEEEGDDVFDAWGAMDDDANDVDPFSAAVASPKPISPAPSSSKPPAIPYDDGGEPDFAGWLAAKSQTKAKNPLPKGLTKAASTNSVATRSTASTVKPRTAVVSKKIDIKPKQEEADDDWGDAWD
jgi:SCY1-like protein 1